MNSTKNMIIRHCIRCDTTSHKNHFQEWLLILQAGSKIKLSDDKPYLDIEHVQEGLNCKTCMTNEIGETVIMVVFKWYQNH